MTFENGPLWGRKNSKKNEASHMIKPREKFEVTLNSVEIPTKDPTWMSAYEQGFLIIFELVIK